jgi:hypothetical protein
VANSGVLEVADGTLTTASGSFDNNGNLLVNGGTLDISGAVTGNGTATIAGTTSILELAAASAQNVNFATGAAGTLKLNAASSFTGTVAGLADGDRIDLANFQFSNNPTITNVTGTGAAGSTTNVTVNDGSINVTLALLNQYANQFAVSSTAYSLTADNNASNHGTQLQLATPHSA